MIFFKMILGLLKRDPRFMPLEKTSIPFYDRIMEILPSLNRKYPSKFSRILIYRHYLKKYKSPLHSQILKLKTSYWKLRLYISKQFQDYLYISISKQRRLKYIMHLFLGLCIGSFLTYTENLPGHENWTFAQTIYPSVHYMLPYILEDVHIKNSPDYFKKDNLALGIDRLMLKGIDENGLDSLSWLVLATRFASMQQLEFSYLSFQMAHYKDHQRIGGNSMQPLDGLEASRFFSKK